MSHAARDNEIDISKVNPQLKSYIETRILPQYSKNEWGHQIGHINYVIRRSFEFANQVNTANQSNTANQVNAANQAMQTDQTAKAQTIKPTQSLNPNIIYTAAAYHDLGHHIDATHHEKVSAEILRKDENLKQFLSPDEIETIAEAIEDHRSHRDQPPRSIYGKIITSADCNINIDVMLRRTYTYRLRNFSNFSLDEVINDARQHLASKYGENGYALRKMFFDDSEFKAALKGLQNLTSDEQLFRERFLKVNHLEHTLELEQQLSEYIAPVNPSLRTYVETNILPQYSKNDRAHGILHIREVIRRSFLLNDIFSLSLDPNLIYTIAAYHDLGKHIDSDRHEFISAKLLREDAKVYDYFSPEEVDIIAEAIEDHRSSKSDVPRSTYGKLISSADRNTRVEMVFVRSFFVGKDRQPETTVKDFLDYTFRRLSKRYSEDDPENMFYADDEYRNFLSEIRALLRGEEAFKNRYCEINQISSREHTLAEEPGVEISPVILI